MFFSTFLQWRLYLSYCKTASETKKIIKISVVRLNLWLIIFAYSILGIWCIDSRCFQVLRTRDPLNSLLPDYTLNNLNGKLKICNRQVYSLIEKDQFLWAINISCVQNLFQNIQKSGLEMHQVYIFFWYVGSYTFNFLNFLFKKLNKRRFYVSQY